MWAVDMVGWNLCKLGMNVALVSWIYLLGSAFRSSKHREEMNRSSVAIVHWQVAECLWLFLHTAGVISILSSCKPLTSYLYKCTETSQSYVIALFSLEMLLLLTACCAHSLSRVRLFVTPWTVAHQAPLSMGILQVRILEWVAVRSFRASSQPRDRTQVSCIVGRRFIVWANNEI